MNFKNIFNEIYICYANIYIVLKSQLQLSATIVFLKRPKKVNISFHKTNYFACTIRDAQFLLRT